jgi:hypothetical protein
VWILAECLHDESDERAPTGIEDDPLYAVRSDDFVQIRLSWFF